VVRRWDWRVAWSIFAPLMAVVVALSLLWAGAVAWFGLPWWVFWLPVLYNGVYVCWQSAKRGWVREDE
jgi:hypothetical protein